MDALFNFKFISVGQHVNCQPSVLRPVCEIAKEPTVDVKKPRIPLSHSNIGYFKPWDVNSVSFEFPPKRRNEIGARLCRRYVLDH